MNSNASTKTQSYLYTYLAGRMISATKTILLVNINLDCSMVDCFASDVASALVEHNRTDIIIQRVSIPSTHLGEIDEVAGGVTGCSITLLLCDPSKLTVDPQSVDVNGSEKPAPLQVADYVYRLICKIAASINSGGVMLETDQDKSNLSVLPIVLIQNAAADIALARLLGRLLNQRGITLYIVARSIQNDQMLGMQFIERWGRVPIVILAAGKSRRMGRAKQVERVDGQVMVVTAINKAILAGAHDILLITGAYRELVCQAVDSSGLSTHPALHLLHNSAYAEGQATSVVAAITHLASSLLHEAKTVEHDIAIVMPVDQPYLNPLLITRLIRLWRRGALLAAPSVHGVPRGAPALFDRSLWENMLQLSKDVGAKQLLRVYHEQLVTIDTPPAELRDIDTPADLQAQD